MFNYEDYFVPELEEYHPEWDGTIDLKSIHGKLDIKTLSSPLPCGRGWIAKGFTFDGSSSGPFRFLIPKWRHPIASARHDFRCALIRQLRYEGMAKPELNRLRKISDVLFKKDLLSGQTNQTRSFVETNVGYIGVRIGAFFGAGF